MIVATPTRPMVHGSACRMTSATGAMYVNEMPRSPCSSSLQYATYWSHSDMFSSSPNSARSASAASGLIRPWFLAIRALTGSPGMIRGMKKLIVIAAQAVIA